ncbi:cellulose synthase/poly-beta-1,6-N-acetylglucosamine synthase-like glycosyltransferase [Larkinella arboricola]|uniref:Cellulose synthase/poly-beta-1,6-N-acetylglucosamine synthase-like glycosyltransferase n=1 Tax=Larkinella arboricola TaxID=643671 RepID=A0A327WXJ8_LARAB|nr:cellulose synthase family protein [Larkinella arboricola]RAJ98027.1 cellulose synthase/poly-beta-1,6-N-acetylglucosamine synthase-like glycosyltransferase [Larkinella arboricola]
MEVIIILLYALVVLLLFAYNCGQLSLIISYLRSKRRQKAFRQYSTRQPHPLPVVTVQLPVYNELYVASRLIDAVANLNYPRSQFEIQVLDDSTDETVAIIAEKVAQYQQQGIDIQHIRRPDRKGFKAGALAYGLDQAKGEFIAIFDADFMPDPDFLLKTVPHFENPKVGIVQTRWTHLNENYSVLTQLQAFGLNAHFFVEQGGRNADGYFMNFNGTAGVWRKTTILDAGSWSSDTLTEDLDLSYRAQLKGWQFVYREDIGSPAELPVAMNALKSQQYRWMKGAAECARKLIFKVLRAPNIPFRIKLHAFFHLLSSSTFILIFLLGLLSVPVLYIRINHPEYQLVFLLLGFFQVNLIILLLFYGIPFWLERREKLEQLGYYFPMYSSLMMGLSLHNTIAVIEGFIGRKTPFVRTPKFNVKTGSDNWRKNKYISLDLNPSINWLTLFEGFLMLYFLFGIGLGFYFHQYNMMVFHVMLAIGFGLVFLYSVFHSRLDS